MNKKFLAGLTAVLTLCPLTACLEDGWDEQEAFIQDSWDDEEEEPESTGAEDGESTGIIRRMVRETTEPMGEAGTWTVFVYICGSDLESDGGFASGDLSEMMSATENDKYRFIVQTGGANNWELENISSQAYSRYEVSGGRCELADSVEASGMGESSTLADFLQWGVAAYPADNMGLILWDHGSGSIHGVCFDEQYEDDSLYLRELDAALYSVYDDLSEPFEFIGFDSCLMSTAETAAMLATHANYMIASQETEPGRGWDYTAIGNYLAENPACDGAALGKVICDSFYHSCSYSGKRGATLSVINLSKMDNFIIRFDQFAKQLYETTGSDFTEVARAISAADNFGGNNRVAGYTNMVDTGGILNAAAGTCPAAKGALKALHEAVVYQIRGKEHLGASGLSMYYPLLLRGSLELSVYKDIALSGYYLATVDKIAYGAAGNGDPNEYDNSYLIEHFGNYWNTDLYTVDNSGDYSYTLVDIADWAEEEAGTEMEYDLDEYEAGESDITFAQEPALDEDGNFCFTLDAESLEKTDYVEAGVCMVDDEEMIWLGITGEVYMDWDTGECMDGFDHYWFCLPDGQYLSAYLWEKCDEYDIYTAPIELNGEDTYLRFAYDEEECDVWILDVWDGVDESGAVGRTGRELEEGDVIVPLYDAYNFADDEDFQYVGEEYVFDGDTALYFQHLEDGVYEYCFYINDIYGNYYTTDSVTFTIEGEDIYFSEE